MLNDLNCSLVTIFLNRHLVLFTSDSGEDFSSDGELETDNVPMQNNEISKWLSFLLAS